MFTHSASADSILGKKVTMVKRLSWNQLEDLKVLVCSPDLLNNGKIGQSQLQLIMEKNLLLPYAFWSSDLNNLMNDPSNSPVISEKKMFRYECGSPNECPWIKGHRSADIWYSIAETIMNSAQL